MELAFVSLNVLGEAVVELDNLVLELPTLSVGSSSVVVHGVLKMGLVKSPVSGEAGLSLLLLGVLAGVSCILESSFVGWGLSVLRGLLLLLGIVLWSFLFGFLCAVGVLVELRNLLGHWFGVRDLSVSVHHLVLSEFEEFFFVYCCIGNMSTKC